MADWHEDALCATPTFKEIARNAGVRKDSAEIFFPVTEDDDGKPFPTNKPRHKRYDLMEARFERIARATCAECPVRIDCLLETLELEQFPYGIFGALDPENRTALLEEGGGLHKRECTCGITIYGVKGHTPEHCSANCRGKK